MPLFETLSLPYYLIFDNDNDKFPPPTHHQPFTPPFFIPLLKTTTQFDWLLFRNEATVTILCFYTILLNTSSLVLKITQLMLINCLTNLLLLLEFLFTPLHALNLPQLPPHVQCANEMDIHPPNGFGTDQGSVHTAGKSGILNTIVMNCNVIKFASTPTCSTV